MQVEKLICLIQPGDSWMDRRKMLKVLHEKVAACKKCPELAESRTQTVMDSGNPSAEICFVAEAPGRNEDVEGEVLVGKAGRLLTNIIKAAGWDRQTQTYLMNILKCRPPQNRTPTVEECQNCLPFFKLQLRIVNPKYIICLGNVAAQNLLNREDNISSLRGQLYDYEDDPVKAKVLCTYHPSFALRQGDSAKEQIWDDMQILLDYMEKNSKL